MSKFQENKINQAIYREKKLSKKMIVFCSVGILLASFAVNFPLGQIIKSKMRDVISKSSRQCKIDIGPIDFEFLFLPKVILENIFIPGICFKKPSHPGLAINKVAVYYRPSFWPLGIRLAPNFSLNNQDIELVFIKGMSKNHIRVDDLTISLQHIMPTLAPLISAKGSIAGQVIEKFSGNFKINIASTIEKKKIVDLTFRIDSKDFKLLPISYWGMDFPLLDIGNFVMASQGKFEKNKLRLDFGKSKAKKSDKGINIGDGNSPLVAKFNGLVHFNQSFIQSSVLNLMGKLRIGGEITEQVPLITTLLNGKLKKNGDFYDAALKGSFSNPKLSPTN